MAIATELAGAPARATVSRCETTRAGERFRPNVDIIERPHELTVVADMPGARGGEIDVQFENGTLTITGPVCPRQANGTKYLVREYGVGDFVRTFKVSENIDAQKITAEFAAGVLTLHLPKVEAVRPRKITVKTE